MAMAWIKGRDHTPRFVTNGFRDSFLKEFENETYCVLVGLSFTFHRAQVFTKPLLVCFLARTPFLLAPFFPFPLGPSWIRCPALVLFFYLLFFFFAYHGKNHKKYSISFSSSFSLFKKIKGKEKLKKTKKKN